MEEFEEGTTGEELGNDAQAGRLHDGAHEQDHVGVA